jgi:4-methylaminobutanoate oxidase (formaldehyde-forming)
MVDKQRPVVSRGHSLPSTADVVVIGGGILGCCAAYHLRLAGAGGVVLLEREPALATQTTWAGAGFVALWSACGETCEPELSLERYALDFYSDLSSRHAIGLKQVGMLWLATAAPTASTQRDLYALARTRVSAEEVALLTPDEAVALVPMLEPGCISSALYWPTACRVSAPLAARAVGAELIAAGVDVLTATEVIGVDVVSGRVAGVRTTSGTIATGAVVNAAGAWLDRIARMAGVVIPLVPLPASRFVTEPLPEVTPDLPLLMFSDHHGMYIREEDGGLLIGSEEIVVHPPSLMRLLRNGGQGVPGNVAALADNTHRYHRAIARDLAGVLPVLERIIVREVRNGMPTRTPDLRHLLGAAPEVGGFYLLGADCEIGVTHGPGLGWQLADLIVHGRSTLDLSPFRPAR